MQHKEEPKKIIYKTLSVNALFWGITLLFFTIRFESVDDLRMAELAHGVFTGEYGKRLVYINHTMARLFQLLLSIAPKISWYAVSWVILVATSLFIISYIFIKRNSKYGVAIVALLMLFFGIDFAINLQFTKVASMVTTAGLLLICDNKTNKKWVRALVGTVLMVLGYLIRQDAFLMVLIPFALYYIFVFIKKRKFIFRLDNILFFAKPVIIIVFCIFIARILTIIFSDNQDNERKDYNEFNRYRSELSDLGFPEYESNKELFDSLNITEEDLEYWTQARNFADPDIFNLDSAKKIVDAKKISEEYRNKDFINRFFKEIVLPIFSYEWIYSIVIITIVYILFARSTLMFIIIEYMGIIACEMYFSYLGRYHLERVDKSLFFSLFCIVAWMGLQNIESVENIEFLRTKMLSMALILFVVGIQLNSENYKADYEEVTEMVDQISNDKDNLYLLTMQAEIKWNSNLSAFYPKELGSMSNILPIGGWMSNLPDLEEVKENYEIDNPFRDVVNNENAYLVDVGDGTGILAYIQRHYYENAYLVKCSSVANDINVFQVKCD